LNLLIFECFSGGGHADQKLSSSILSEAYGMLRTAVSDFRMAGHNVTTLLDSRLVALDAPMEANKVIAVCTKNQFEDKIEEFSGKVDAVYVIAPESNQVLEGLLQKVNDSGGMSLNCEVDSVKTVSNKITAHEVLKKSGVKVPDTVFLDTNEKLENIRNIIRELEYPLLFKPADGTSCGGLSVIQNENQIPQGAKRVRQESTSKQFLAQRLIKGKTASACVLSSGDKAVALSVNKQLVTLASPKGESKYFGGEVPFNHKLEKCALKVAEKAVEAVKGLRGYVGVDMLLTDEEAIVIEINPRLTVSYVGLQKVATLNMSNAIIDAVTKRKIPVKHVINGGSYFSKVEVPCCPQNVSETYKLINVVSPPFPTHDKKVYALVATASNTIKGAKSAFYRTKKRLLSTCGAN
jgi:tyramine---L-glutamate ligase